MKNLLLTAFLIFNILAKGQSGCTQTITPAEIYYPNSVSSSTNNLGVQYLCGPNTVVYDTVYAGCRTAYVNSGSTLTINTACVTGHAVWLKNNATLNIGAQSSVVGIFFEPGAIINNPFGVGTSTVLCTNITFPVGNCVTAINEVSIKENIFKIYPNPSSTMINVGLEMPDDQLLNLTITNQLGEIVYQVIKSTIIDNPVSIENLSNGLYFVHVKTKCGQQTKNIVVMQ